MSTNNRRLIQVVPQLKPGRCGVSDYAISLAQELENRFGVSTAFVVLNSNEQCDIPFPRIDCAPSRLLDACLKLSNGQPSAVLLQYSGYGFASNGVPLSLPEALERVRSSGQFRVAAYFHELFATAMPWRSAFWNMRRQKAVVREIVKKCDFMMTNINYHRDWLKHNAVRGDFPRLQQISVSSNAGECSALPPMSARRTSLLVFGLPGTRRRSYKKLFRTSAMLDTLGIQEIIDIGPECNAPSVVNGILVKRIGTLDVADLGSLFSKSMFGFVPHPSFCLAKSGVFAALCAHGTIPVIGKSFSDEVDGLRDGVHLVSPRTARIVLTAGLETCSAAGWNWYSEHRLHVHAATYLQLLFQS